MDAVTEPIDEPMTRRRWLAATPAIELAVVAGGIAIAAATYFTIAGVGGEAAAEPRRLLNPPLVALLLVANLVPWMALLVLIGRRVAHQRAERSPVGGGGKLHVRLVAIFSVLASVPMLLVTIFASLLFQYGVEFWLSDRARGMLENANALAQESYQQLLSFVENETLAMAGDLSAAMKQVETDNPEFGAYFGQQVYYRNLSEGIVFSVTPSGEIMALALVDPYERELANEIGRDVIRRLNAGETSVTDTAGDRSRSVTRIPGTDLYLYAARVYNLDQISAQTRRARSVLEDYRALVGRSRSLQLQFNAALMVMSLLMVGLAVFVALAVADRLVRPVGDLVDAARRITGGDLTARVPAPTSNDEVGTLANAFNDMTGRLQEQTGALVTANAQLESRSALIEAVMSGVSAGVISIGPNRTVRLINSSAIGLLRAGGGSPVGRPLRDVAPELDDLLGGDAREAIVQLNAGGEAKTLAVKITRDAGGQILTFDDITQQLLDQRRAAWSDVARRIAHEIKNPLTPIQLAAERLQRRYGKTIDPQDGTFARLTDTIVRQVGDLRRMVDEFSSFARMPKPVFRPESIVDIVRQSVFLHEVAHPEIDFSVEVAEGVPPLVCDRRQLGQAVTNIVKNAVEAVEARGADAPRGLVATSIALRDDGCVAVAITDNGVGLPIERDRIVEPYMTTRSRGTGLGLAIVKKIVEEHFGSIGFADRAGGGTVVTIALDPGNLELHALNASASADTAASDGGLTMLTRNRNG
ncbi:sensor histidine kinase [Sphingomonas japonica]|uniref:histidine kinase n=1 Tax=Sphingomonas japonica TaxID=511662 RepID=A0ABX0U2W2_9SPHN|nr:ATP-binding protein [Sphingomonas japonica]NIJ24870.1 two-component system nitrogen regulation sensor histidine kinase NtrY [Sphingomonas japonica]